MFFVLSGNAPGNSRYDSSDPSSAPTNIKFKRKQNYEGHFLVYLAIFSLVVSSPYIYRSKIVIRS